MSRNFTIARGLVAYSLIYHLFTFRGSLQYGKTHMDMEVTLNRQVTKMFA